jgi:hypothetical protein
MNVLNTKLLILSLENFWSASYWVLALLFSFWNTALRAHFVLSDCPWQKLPLLFLTPCRRHCGAPFGSRPEKEHNGTSPENRMQFQWFTIWNKSHVLMLHRSTNFRKVLLSSTRHLHTFVTQRRQPHKSQTLFEWWTLYLCTLGSCPRQSDFGGGPFVAHL